MAQTDDFFSSEFKYPSAPWQEEKKYEEVQALPYDPRQYDEGAWEQPKWQSGKNIEEDVLYAPLPTPRQTGGGSSGGGGGYSYGGGGGGGGGGGYSYQPPGVPPAPTGTASDLGQRLFYYGGQLRI